MVHTHKESGTSTNNIDDIPLHITPPDYSQINLHDVSWRRKGHSFSTFAVIGHRSCHSNLRSVDGPTLLSRREDARDCCWVCIVEAVVVTQMAAESPWGGWDSLRGLCRWQTGRIRQLSRPGWRRHASPGAKRIAWVLIGLLRMLWLMLCAGLV